MKAKHVFIQLLCALGFTAVLAAYFYLLRIAPVIKRPPLNFIVPLGVLAAFLSLNILARYKGGDPASRVYIIASFVGLVAVFAGAILL